MCTQARLVQAGQVSDWLGMSHDGAPPALRIPLRAGQPATLEVRIDPAAHGDAGLGPIERGVRVVTAGGQALEFVLRAQVVR